MKRSLYIWIAGLVLLALACNMSGQTGSPPEQPQTGTAVSEGQPLPDQPEEQNQSQVIVETQIVVVTATPGPTEIPSKPVSIRSGLNSLNSYAMTVRALNTGPTPQDMSENTVEMRYSSEQDAQETRQVSRSSSADSPEVEEDVMTLYRVGLNQCTESGGEFQVESIPPAQQEMTDLMVEMLDMTPIISNPTYVGPETINDIETNHFTFQISGLGVTSGAQVLTNEGEYWLAVDGSYIVKYSLVLETQDNEGRLMHFEVNIDLTQVNQPVEIVMPEGCK